MNKNPQTVVATVTVYRLGGSRRMTGLNGEVWLSSCKELARRDWFMHGRAVKRVPMTAIKIIGVD